ncbi:hypothetical protein [Sulfobacillus harzensis]|uniref:NnrS family protein n=1 Tax=Sulfobacillus harzensis TaxID=2729629 RepID=A0A7Y0L4P7_9FIRM|nr:hypothetical protein [Sulfobacillus harzensis]NMP23262.1 hypothetical protein [Sulfobacillus harzensis]
MDNPTSSTERYKPSINIAQAPRIMAPLLYLGTAYVFLAAGAWMLFRYRADVSQGAYGVPGVIMMVHLFTLGFLSMTALGILHQWIPVVFDVPPLGLRRVVFNFALYVAGFLGFACGFAYDWWPVVAASGSALAVAILWWSSGVISQLRRSPKPRDAVYWGISAAVLGFNVVWVLGLFMAASFLGWWPEYQVLRVHIATALGAWMGILVLTVQQKLNPMFSMSKAQGVRFALPLAFVGAGIVLAWLSLFTSTRLLTLGAVLWVVGTVVTISQLLAVLRQGKAQSFDRVFIGVGMAWILFLAAAIVSMELNPLAMILAFWGFFTLILSYQGRILPFIVAVAVAKRLPGPVYKAFFMAQAMHPKNLPVIMAIGGCAGAVFMVWGRLAHHPALVGVSAGVAALLLLLQIGGVVLAMRAGHKQGPPARS